jgi:TAT-translocated FGD2 family F420-dependent dehydrogenase
MDTGILDPKAGSARMAPPGLRTGMIGYMLAHEQFTVPQLVEIGAAADKAGFDFLACSDHFQPWQANEGHSGAAWVTMAALGARAQRAWMGTFVTCPILRYSPAVVAEAFASLSLLYPGRIFLGVGSGEALNEQAATGQWPDWEERWARLIEAIGIIRRLWTGKPLSHHGKYYQVDARLYDAPPESIPILTAANGKKSMRLAGKHGDGLITDPATWMAHRGEWEEGARSAGKDPATMPVIAETFVVVGGKEEAEKAAALWRFIPKAFETYIGIRDPAEIQSRAEAEIPTEKVCSTWAIGTDPKVHIEAIQELFDSGIKLVNIHVGQMDQQHVIEFYAKEVLPALRRRQS